MEIEVKYLPKAKRFRARFDKEVAYIDYEIVNEKCWDVQHTYVPESLRGKGIAADLSKALFDYAKEHGISVIPTCPYLDTFLKRYPEYQEIVVVKE